MAVGANKRPLQSKSAHCIQWRKLKFIDQFFWVLSRNAPGQCPRCSRKQTCGSVCCMSAKCQKRAFDLVSGMPAALARADIRGFKGGGSVVRFWATSCLPLREAKTNLVTVCDRMGLGPQSSVGSDGDRDTEALSQQKCNLRRRALTGSVHPSAILGGLFKWFAYLVSPSPLQPPPS